MSLAMKPTEGGPIAPVRLAASLLLVRDGPDGLQVFMVVRNRAIEFASGALVFPGGKVEPTDLAQAGGDEERASRIAAIRETREECGVQLREPDALTPFAHWITPPILPKRFDTRFYIARAPMDQIAVHDGSEAVDSLWIEPARALDQARQGRWTLVLPTRLNLERLGHSPSVGEAIAAAKARPSLPIEPVATKTMTGYRLTIPAEADYGATDYDV